MRATRPVNRPMPNFRIKVLRESMPYPPTISNSPMPMEPDKPPCQPPMSKAARMVTILPKWINGLPTGAGYGIRISQMATKDRAANMAISTVCINGDRRLFSVWGLGWFMSHSSAGMGRFFPIFSSSGIIAHV